MDVLILFIGVLVLIALRPLVFCVIGIFFLKDFNLDARKGNFGGSSVTTDDLFDGDAVIDLAEELVVLLHVNMGGPSMGNSEESLLEHNQVHARLTTGVMDPFLCDFAAHFFLAVERKEHLVDAFHKLQHDMKVRLV